MRLPHSRTATGLIAIGSAIVLIGSCGTRNDYAATERHHPDAANRDVGELGLRHLQLRVSQNPSKSASVHATLVNLGRAPITVNHIGTHQARHSRFVDPKSRRVLPLTLPPNSTLRMQFPTDPHIELVGLEPSARTGSTVRLNLVVEGKEAAIQVPVSLRA